MVAQRMIRIASAWYRIPGDFPYPSPGDLGGASINNFVPY